MIFTNQDKNSVFEKPISSAIKNVAEIKIAVGYYGHEILKKYEEDFLRVAEIGNSQLLIGMLFHQGASIKKTDYLKQLDEKLSLINPKSGVFLSRKQYHGKIYALGESIFLGSSNFSSEGLRKRLECNVEIQDKATKYEISDYLEKLFKAETTTRISNVSLARKVPTRSSKKLKEYVVTEIPHKTKIGEFEIKIRADQQPCSSLNLYFDKGRKNSKGLYEPRPWYEVEITASTIDINNAHYPSTKPKEGSKKSRIGQFTAYFRCSGKIYKIDMSVGSDNGKAIASSKDSGGRATLGKIMKGVLEEKGLLKFGDRITNEVLERYGRSSLTFQKIDTNEYIIDF